MLRELPLQAAVTTYQATTVAGFVCRIQGYVYTAANPAVDYYIQLFDTLAGAAAQVGLAPLKSWEGQANFQYIFHESEMIPITQGALFVLSTTDAVYTAVTGVGNDMDIQVEIEEYQTLSQKFTLASSLNNNLNAGGFIQAVADGTAGGPLLSKVELKTQNAQDAWLMVFAKSPVGGDRPISSRKVLLSTLGANAEGKLVVVDFGEQNGFRSYSQDSNGTGHNGLYIALSTTGNVYTATAPISVTGTMSIYWWDNTTVAP